MSHPPSDNEAPLEREARCSQGSERALATVSRDEPKTEEAAAPPPPKRRRDAAHRETVRAPFLLE